MVNLTCGKLRRMGGCCCCLSKEVEPPRVLEEAVPLSSEHASAPAVSSGLHVNTNLETSVVNTYRPPPAPVSDNVVVGFSQTGEGAVGSGGNKADICAVQISNSVSVEELVRTNNQENAEKDEDPNLSECKDTTPIVSEKENESDAKLSKNVDPVIASVEECPTCLEEYDEDNPKIIAKCSHHFHLACILEWMERSDTCPVCSKEMILSLPLN